MHKHFLAISFIVGATLCHLGHVTGQLITQHRGGSTSITIESVDVANYRPIKALDDGWYLVQIEQQYTCRNPFPIGKSTIHVLVPHLVRMRASEIDNLKIEM